MLVHTAYLFFNTRQRQEFIRITDDIRRIVDASGVAEGTAGSHRQPTTSNRQPTMGIA